jgi:hypothetical protein
VGGGYRCIKCSSIHTNTNTENNTRESKEKVASQFKRGRDNERLQKRTKRKGIKRKDIKRKGIKRKGIKRKGIKRKGIKRKEIKRKEIR